MQSDAKTEKLKAEARKKSIVEGAVTTIEDGLGYNYVAPYALALNANTLQIGFLSSFPGLFGPIAQIFGSRLIEKYSRKKVLIIFTLLESLLWIPIIILAYLFWKGILTGFLPLFLILFFSILIIFRNMGIPAWFSWMGDIVKENERGKYFSRRNRILGFIALLCTLLGAFFLDFFKKNSLLLLGFVIFFAIAMTCRLIARQIFKKKYEPKLKLEKGYYFSFWQFIRNAPYNNFGKFSIYMALMYFAVFIASPFFVVYMLNSLQFSYVTYTIVFISSPLGGLLILPLLGKFSDKNGNYELMKISSIFISIFPFLWLFSDSPYYLALGPQLMVGMAWAGFNLASMNFIFDSITTQKRGLALSYYNVLIGIGIFLGSIIGGILTRYLTISFLSVFLFVFIISGIARIIASLIMIPRIREIRKVERFDSTKAVKNLISSTAKWPLHEAHQIITHKKFRHQKS